MLKLSRFFWLFGCYLDNLYSLFSCVTTTWSINI